MIVLPGGLVARLIRLTEPDLAGELTLTVDREVRSDVVTRPSENPTRPYTVVDAGIGWRVTSRSRVLAAFRNLLDEAYESGAGPRWVWAPGRHGSVTLVITY